MGCLRALHGLKAEAREGEIELTVGEGLKMPGGIVQISA